MSGYPDRIKTMERSDVAREDGDGEPNMTIVVSEYVHAVLQGVRLLTNQSPQKDLMFLDNLLSMAEDEAFILSTRAYH